MTLLAVAERIEKSLTELTTEIATEKKGGWLRYTAEIGDQAFRITIEELAKDDQEPALT